MIASYFILVSVFTSEAVNGEIAVRVTAMDSPVAGVSVEIVEEQRQGSPRAHPVKGVWEEEEDSDEPVVINRMGVGKVLTATTEKDEVESDGEEMDKEESEEEEADNRVKVMASGEVTTTPVEEDDKSEDVEDSGEERDARLANRMGGGGKIAGAGTRPPQVDVTALRERQQRPRKDKKSNDASVRQGGDRQDARARKGNKVEGKEGGGKAGNLDDCVRIVRGSLLLAAIPGGKEGGYMRITIDSETHKGTAFDMITGLTTPPKANNDVDSDNQIITREEWEKYKSSCFCSESIQ